MFKLKYFKAKKNVTIKDVTIDDFKPHNKNEMGRCPHLKYTFWECAFFSRPIYVALYFHVQVHLSSCAISKYAAISFTPLFNTYEIAYNIKHSVFYTASHFVYI